jgi:hypothetical protein
MASLIRWFTNHADFWVIPSERAISWLLMPFLLLATSQIAGSQTSKPSGESSKMVPSLTENWRRHCLHFQMRRVLRNECSMPPQRGQTGLPSGHRSLTTVASATSGSAK